MAVTEKTDVEEQATPETEPEEAPDTGACVVKVSPDRLSVLLSADNPLGNPDLTVEKITASCEGLSLPQIPDADQLLNLLKESCAVGEPVEELPLITGRAPKPAVDGTLQWAKDFFTEGWAIDDETGAIDFWEKIDQRNVGPGELLVTLTDPVEGEPGEDVFGAPLNTEKAKLAKIRCGKGVHENPVDGGTGIYATNGGKVRFNDGTIAVDEILTIKGDVSLETGNIRHNGTVIIEGDVRDGATLEVLGNVEVKGMLEPCDIQAGGNLTVGGGIVGDEEHRIQVGGNVQARYIHQAVIVAEGDVMVVSEIAHSNIQTRGKVDVSQGRIAGGYTLARKGILVAEAGAGGSAKTELVAGIDPTLKPKLNAIHDRMRKMEGARANILKTIQAHETAAEDLTPAQQQLVKGLKLRVETLGVSLKDAEMNIRRLTAESSRDARLEVVMYKEVRSGTVIQLGERSTLVRNSILKPRIAQRRGIRVRVFPMGEGNTPEE